MRVKDTAEARNEARYKQYVNKASVGASKASSLSTMESKLKEAERHNRSLIASQKKRADLQKQIAKKSSDLDRYRQQVVRYEKEEIKKSDAAERKRIKELSKMQDDLEKRQIKHQKQLKLQNQSRVKAIKQIVETEETQYDVFISHASEDKDSFVREFAKKLQTKGIKVWYDEFTLKWGDSLRENIDLGLSKSRFGIVILSNDFFNKEWPKRELNGLFSLEIGGVTRILPIWHKITKDEVAKHSPMMLDKVAMNTSFMSVDEIISHLVELLD